MSVVVASFCRDKCNVIKTHRFLQQIVTTMTYLWSFSKLYGKKTSMVKVNTFTRANNFINVYAFKKIRSVLIAHF